MAEQAVVRVGQVWQDNDKRSEGRRVKVVRLDEDKGRRWGGPTVGYEYVVIAYAIVRRVLDGGSLIGPYRRIRLDRFRPTSTGYRLVEDVPTESAS